MNKTLLLLGLILTSLTSLAQTLTPFQDTKTFKYGYKDSTGKIVVKPAYDRAYEFGNTPYALVNIGWNHDANGGKWGVINKTGKLIIPVKYDAIRYLGYRLFAVNIGEKFIDEDIREGGQWAVMNATGKALTPFLYNNISAFEDGMAGIETFDPKTKIQKAGYIDSTGKVAIPLKYDGVAFPFENGYATVTVKNRWGLIDKKGKLVIALEYDGLSNVWKEGIIKAKKAGKWGFINLANEMVIPFEYDDVKCNSENRIAVNKGATTNQYGFTRGGKWGYMDVQGKVVIPIEYDQAFCFLKGIADVQKNGAKLKIDLAGNVIPGK